MCKNAKKKLEDARAGDATAKTPSPSSTDDRLKSILPPPDPELDGWQKRGLGVFKRGPGVV
jgi:hypothetical protein